MGKYVIKRILIMIPILIGISFIVQVLVSIAPGDPARSIVGADREEWEYEKVREELGLDKPMLVRYWDFISNVLKGNLGVSFFTKRPIWSEIATRFPYTLMIALLSVALAVLVGIPLGIFAATNQFTWKDSFAVLLSLIVVSMPSFWFALLLVQFFSVKLRLLPVSGIANWQGYILPVVSIALGYAASIMRQMRSNMLEVIRQDYIITARAKGLSEGKVLYKHALKNALIPVVMTIGVLFGMSLGGALIAETIYSLPGLGSFTLAGLQNRDYPVIQGSVLFMSVISITMMLLIDIAFSFIDPRIRSQYTRRRRGAKEGLGRKAA
ncbi:MAG: ABC transporter permease [Oscillospiraceae bacterium]|nr:ABC transporter permease [Oscillospiraceae bacterium]